MDSEIETMLDDIKVHQEKLSDWDAGFIDGVEFFLKKGASPEKVESKIKKIWERIT